MSGGHTFADGDDDENVIVTSGDVTSISDAPPDGDPVAAGGAQIAVSLTPAGDLLNIAFVTGGGDVQIIQITLADLMQPAATSSDGDVVVSAELTTLSGDVISAGSGAATPVGTIAVATNLREDGDLQLSFVDGDAHLQLIETNVAALLHGLKRGDDATASGPQQRSGPPAA